MKIWSQSEMDELITCEKRTADPPKKVMRMESGSYRNEAIVESTDGQHGFRVFIRQNVKFPENFTIGLDYVPRDEPGSICLLRCNGPHGPHFLWKHHTHFHIHRAIAENVNEGRKAEAHAEITTAYASLEEAIRHFGREANILDWDSYFPDLQQMLFKDIS